MNHVMLDLETLDTSSNAVVVSIGAVAFDPYGTQLGASFYVEMTNDLSTQVERGGTISPSTVSWWAQQSPEARAAIVQGVDRPRETTVSALRQFTSFIRDLGGSKTRVWGNGADFDNVILANLYARFGESAPWSGRYNRCYRTVRREFEANVPVVRHGVYHNALDDAITQARHLQTILARRELNYKKWYDEAMAATNEAGYAGADAASVIRAMSAELANIRENAARYECLRSLHWHDSEICVVAQPKESVKLGYDCPSEERLDEVVDRIRGAKL